MVTITCLLHQAYSQSEAGNIQYAKVLLESLVSIQPLNTEAWEAYLQLCQSCEELDYLCERVQQCNGFHHTDLESILDYYYFLRQKLKLRYEEADPNSIIIFELVDQFTYALKDQSFTMPDSIQDHPVFVGLPDWLLGKSVIVSYAILLIASLKLLVNGNLIGFWIHLTLTVGIFINLWKIIFPEIKEEIECANTCR